MAIFNSYVSHYQRVYKKRGCGLVPPAALPSDLSHWRFVSQRRSLLDLWWQGTKFLPGEGVYLNWWTSLCLLNLVNACLPYLFHSSILLEFRTESVRSRLGSWKEAASQERLRFQAGFLLMPFLGLSKSGVPQNPVVYHHVHQLNGYLGYCTPCLSKCIMDITLGLWYFELESWLFWDHPFIDLGLFNSGLTSIEELESEQLKEYGDTVLLRAGSRQSHVWTTGGADKLDQCMLTFRTAITTIGSFGQLSRVLW